MDVEIGEVGESPGERTEAETGGTRVSDVAPAQMD